MIENLNKANFWDALHAKYPTAVDHFCQWIDEYKKEVNWKSIFSDGVKFHDIPFEMQNGIIARFELEVYNNKLGAGKETYRGTAVVYRQQFMDLFADIQRNSDNRAKALN